MNKSRSQYLYDLVGVIREKKRVKFKDRDCFKLIVELTNYPQVSFIQAFQDKLTKQQIWEEIEQSKFIDKRYIFHCQNYFGSYHLVDWKEIAFVSQKTEEIKRVFTGWKKLCQTCEDQQKKQVEIF